MKRALLFTGGFALAFCSSVALQFSGGHPETLWALFILVGAALSLVPKTAKLPLKLSMLGAYAAVFAILWTISNPAQTGSRFDEKIGLLALLLLVGAAIFAFALLGVAYVKLKAEQPMLRIWALIVALTGLIAYFSSPHGGAGIMTEFLMRHLGMAKDSANSVVLVLRKTIHFSYYGSIGLCALRFAQAGEGNRRAAITFALLFVLFHASFDEIRQSGEENRTGSFWDVCLDMAGAAAFVAIGSKRPALRPQVTPH